jgi:hypothetical protein
LQYYFLTYIDRLKSNHDNLKHITYNLKINQVIRNLKIFEFFFIVIQILAFVQYINFRFRQFKFIKFALNIGIIKNKIKMS